MKDGQVNGHIILLFSLKDRIMSAFLSRISLFHKCVRFYKYNVINHNMKIEVIEESKKYFDYYRENILKK